MNVTEALLHITGLLDFVCFGTRGAVGAGPQGCVLLLPTGDRFLASGHPVIGMLFRFLVGKALAIRSELSGGGVCPESPSVSET